MIPSSNESPLKAEFQYYLDHQTELVEQYNGQVIVIRDRQVIGVFDDAPTAIAETSKTFPLGTFLVQKVTPGDGAYTQSFHSQVVFR